MRFIFLLITGSFLSACGSLANIDYDSSINFNALKTYSIQLKPVRASSDTRINSPFMQQRVFDSIAFALQKKGFTKKSKNAGLQVKYYLDVQKDFETEESAISVGFGSSGYRSAIGFGFTVPVGETYSVDKLVLTIDMVSTKTKKLVWRGSLAYHIASGSTPETNTRMINELVTEILKDFPPQ